MGVTALDNQSMAEDKFPTLQFFTPVTSASCAEAIEVIGQFAGRPDTTLRFLINSPGGEVQSGLGLMDVMDEVIASGTKIETVALGEAASMGGFLLQSGTTRRMGKHARLLIHRISSIFGGTNTEQEEAAARMLEIQTRAMPRLPISRRCPSRKFSPCAKARTTGCTPTRPRRKASSTTAASSKTHRRLR